MAFILHWAFQTQHIAPGVLMGLRSPNDPIPEGERAFIFASIKKSIIEGDIPITKRDFSKPKPGGGD